MTRAKKQLIFTRPAGKDNKPYIDSPFIVESGISGEILENKIDDEIIKNSIKNELL